VVVALAIAFGGHALAKEDEPVTLRIATSAPKGTSWAKDLQAFASDVETRTKGRVKVKLYLGGVAGDESAVEKRIVKGQLEGEFSGGPMCNAVMPSMRVFELPGMFSSQDEAVHVGAQLYATLQDEAKASGYRLLATGSVGPLLVFSKTPVSSLDDLRKLKLWAWDDNTEFIDVMRAMNMTLTPAPLDGAQALLDAGKIDGFWATPLAALAFQWYVGTSYLIEVPAGFLMGCALVRQDAMDRIASEDEEVIMSAAAKLSARIDQDNASGDAELLGGVFEKQGLKKLVPSQKMWAEYFQAAREAREKVSDKLLPKALLPRVNEILGDYRAEHPSAGK
jgi:TRAP-type C4-dicarboxylate transport system substrate-binding protein